ncbi:hypothetical protein SAMN04488543_1748 [Friedmanniella luteola]|uniref:Uncharacterized protein n=1 Tax=Friedmanniella luteola TaxID=546871 RepID=A0A1H1SA61_9ACTN|nr:hypothetical protein [Friedmanniella luteola]SDS44854.1 hypothetical protein SAMN04488543_1748 [Friedmanniella luteola]
MFDTPWLVIGVAALLVAVLFASVVRLERAGQRRWNQETSRPGWWAPAAEQERLQRILARNPSYDERTGLTSDPELARWLHDNRP